MEHFLGSIVAHWQAWRGAHLQASGRCQCGRRRAACGVLRAGGVGAWAIAAARGRDRRAGAITRPSVPRAKPLACYMRHSGCEQELAELTIFFRCLARPPVLPDAFATAPSSQPGSHHAGAVSSAPLQLLRPEPGGAFCSATQPVCLT